MKKLEKRDCCSILLKESIANVGLIKNLHRFLIYLWVKQFRHFAHKSVGASRHRRTSYQSLGRASRPCFDCIVREARIFLINPPCPHGEPGESNNFENRMIFNSCKALRSESIVVRPSMASKLSSLDMVCVFDNFQGCSRYQTDHMLSRFIQNTLCSQPFYTSVKHLNLVKVF